MNSSAHLSRKAQKIDHNPMILNPYSNTAKYKRLSRTYASYWLLKLSMLLILRLDIIYLPTQVPVRVAHKMAI